jgi:two-component system response regulator MprA/two-component system C4-dicarboxylate transport response regulator DctD
VRGCSTRRKSAGQIVWACLWDSAHAVSKPWPGSLSLVDTALYKNSGLNLSEPQPLPDDVLVAEDDDDLRESLTDLLRCQGYRVRAVGNGRDVLMSVARNPPRLLLLDLMMPGINGWEILGSLRRTGVSVPVMVITATRQLAPTPEIPVFHKPLDTQSLLQAIEDSLAPR